MPRYDYDCIACGTRFEVLHGVHADRPTTCPACGGGPIRKAITAPAVHFKGSGWAKKERRVAPASSSAKGGASEPSPAGSGSERGSSGDGGSGDKAANAGEPAAPTSAAIPATSGSGSTPD